MSLSKPKQVTDAETAGSRWKDLYKIAGVVTLIMIVFIPIQIVIYILWPIPDTAIDSFTLFQTNKLLGLLSLELTYIISNILSVPLYLALYVALRRVNESLMAIATAFGFIAIAVIFAARPAFEMLYLSDQYAAATTDAQRAMFLATGQARLTSIHGTAQQVHYVLGAVALLMISVVMFKSDIFSKVTAYMGILANVLAFGLYVPKIGIYLSIFSVFPFLTVWLILVARRFIQLGSLERTTHPQQS